MSGVIARFKALVRAPLHAARLAERQERQLETVRQLAGSVKRVDERLAKQSIRLDKLQEHLHLTRREISGHEAPSKGAPRTPCAAGSRVELDI